MNKTETEAIVGTQADASQQLTSAVDTARFATPTMTFGEVGVTEQVKTSGQELEGHGLGEFLDTQLLERSVLVTEFDWLVTDTDPVLFTQDLDQYLRSHPRNQPVMRQFRYYRADIEATVRLNTNQFYLGALMCTLFPGKNGVTGNWRDERSVLNPIVLSASSAESAILEWQYGWPDMWKSTETNDDHPCTLVIDNLHQLHQASPSIPDRVRVSVWARFKNVKLAYPFQPEAQSSSVSVKRPMGNRARHPADDPGAHSGSNPMNQLLDAVKNTTIGDAVDFAEDAAGALFSLFDKPERTDPQQSMIIEAGTDMYATDIPDSSVTVGMYKDRYLDPAKRRMPMSDNWTISKFAQIPTLKGQYTITPSIDQFYIEPMEVTLNADQLRSMLEYAQKNAYYWRGSIKVMFQFFTSSFTSSRFAVQVINQKEYPDGNSSDYTGGVTAVINVKGDTIHTMTIPWNSKRWWEDGPYIRIYVNKISPIVSTIDGADPRIYLSFWVAGGEDIQFAFPRIPADSEWGYREPPLEAQCSIGKEFLKPFEPIVAEAVYDYDNGACTNEQLGLITDITKRYSRILSNAIYDGTYMDGQALDANFLAPPSNSLGGNVTAFRRTYFGMWRAAFLYRSGGYRFRQIPARLGNFWNVGSVDTALNGTSYMPPFDQTTRLSIPQIMFNPYGMLGELNGQVGIDRKDLPLNSPVSFVAARDDIQFGYPILPQGILPNPSLASARALEKKRSS